jgi:tRNA modification GTPase
MSVPRLAVLTGEGLGAVAVVRVWGEGSIGLVDAAFRPHGGSGLARTPPGRPRVGRIGSGLGDEVVAIIASDEPEAVEVHCHGGPAAIALVVDGLTSRGASRVSASEWVRHRAPSALRAEAIADLPLATTLRAASHLLDQANGALDRELGRIHDQIESHPPSAEAGIDRLLAFGEVGTRLVGGWRVVLAGRPNVGKSRLLNALAGFDRAIVDPTPGTTRDVVAFGTAFDGWPVELADTAGLRETVDPIEAAGVAKAEAQQSRADLILLVLDRSAPMTDDDRGLQRRYPGSLVVANKSDLPPAWAFEGLNVSASRGDGIEELAREIGRRLVPEPPAEGSALLLRSRHLRRLRLIRSALGQRRSEWARRALGRWIARIGE